MTARRMGLQTGGCAVGALTKTARRWKGIQQQKIKLMSGLSLWHSLDGLSSPPLKGKAASWFGCIGSALLLTAVLGFYVPAVLTYLSGNYYQSMFETNTNFIRSFYSRDDYKLAIVLRNKQDGSLYDHSAILANFQAYLSYDNLTGSLYEPLVQCDQKYFTADVNGVTLQDCLMVPDYVEYSFIYELGSYSSLSLVLKPPAFSNPFYSSTFQAAGPQVDFANLLANYYCEFYFSSKVVLPSGGVSFQLHRAYSTQINVASDTLGANMEVRAGLRSTLMDNSIMPWRNYRNVTVISYTGDMRGNKTLNLQSAVTYGMQQTFKVVGTMEVAARYYKKLDWLLGIIGGGMFLFFIIFWPIFNYYNRTTACFQLVNQLLLQKTTNDYPMSEDELIPVKIPLYYMLVRLLPPCRQPKYEKLMEESQNYNGIVLQLKKLKVAWRNMSRLGLITQEHDAKVISLPEIEKINEEETSSHPNSSVFSDQNDRAHYGHINNQSHLSHQNQRQPSAAHSLDDEDMSEEQEQQEVANSPVIVAGAASEREGLEGSHHPIMQEVPMQQENPIDPDQFEQFQALAVPVPPMHSPQPQSHQQNEVPSVPVAVNAQNQLVINADIQNHVVINAAPQQVIIVGTQQQIEEYNRRQPPVQPHEPALFSNPPSSPPTHSPHPRDDKFNLTAEQLACLHAATEPAFLRVLENNPTFQAMRREKENSFAELMELEEIDKWEGHYELKIKKCAKRCAEAVGKFFRTLDLFAVRVTLTDLSGSTTCCGVFLTIAIVILAILTFALTIGNMGQTQYIISQNYLPLSQLSFSRATDNDFNAVVCAAIPGYFQGSSRLADLNFFLMAGGVKTTYTPVRVTASDPVMSIASNVHFISNGLNVSNCFRMPLGVGVSLDANGAHFGFQFTTYCSNTPSYCNSTQSQTNSNFVNAFTNNSVLLFLPGSRLNPATNTLATDIYVTPYINLDLLKVNLNTSMEETVYVNQVRLFDDSGNSFMRHAPPLTDTNLNAGYNTRRTYVKAAIASKPSYTFRVKLNQAATDYTVTQKKLDWITGIIGGVFVFWYALVHLLAVLYMRFNFNAYVAKLVYEEEGYEADIVKKVLAMLRVPRCLLPRCNDIRRDTDRMRAVHDKMEASLTHLGLLKYIDNCFRLSSAFFSSLQAKNFSLLYFRQKIFENEQVVPRQQQPQKVKIDDLQEPIEGERLDQPNANKIFNSNAFMGETEEQGVFDEGELAQAKMHVEHEEQRDNIIDDPPSGPPQYFDVFHEPPAFSFNGSRTYTSATGGICCLLMLLFIILVAVYEVSMYLNNEGTTTSYDVIMDDGANSTGITLKTGANFKLAVAFMDTTSLQPVNVSTFLPYVGISLLKQRYSRNNGLVVPNITTIDLVPCPSGSIQSWVGSNVDLTYFSGLTYAYCAPDNVSLQIVGSPESQSFSAFKVSIYNKAGDAGGLANLTKLLNTTYVMLYFSSPRENSVSRNIEYQMEAMLFAGLKTLTPFETNMTLSRSKVTYDDSHDWLADPATLESYRFEAYNEEWMGYDYYGSATSSLWFNVSFSNTQKLHIYTITAPKFYEVFGIIGGIIAFFFLLVACCVSSFNTYKLRYEIGKKLYHFDKKRITETKERIKMKLRKSTSDRKRIQRMNDLSELQLLEAFLLRPIAFISNNYNFNDSLRVATLIQQRVTQDLDLPQLYLTLYRVRDAISKKIRSQTNPPIKLTDIFFKKIANPDPRAYTIEVLRNYAKSNHLSSYQQMVAFRAREARVKVNEIFDSKFLQNVFNVVDDGREINMGMMNDTVGSVNSSLPSSINQSVSDDVTGANPDDL